MTHWGWLALTREELLKGEVLPLLREHSFTVSTVKKGMIPTDAVRAADTKLLQPL